MTWKLVEVFVFVFWFEPYLGYLENELRVRSETVTSVGEFVANTRQAGVERCRNEFSIATFFLQCF